MRNSSAAFTEGAAPSNFGDALGQRDSELAQQVTKDPFTLEFLAIDSDVSERDLKERLVARMIDTLRELGPNFAFVGRQVHFDVDGDDFCINLVFFHVEQLRYLVIELKTTKFDPQMPDNLASTLPSSTTDYGSTTNTGPPSACSS